MPKIVVIGGGIAGLSAAYRIREAEPAAEVRVLEASARHGGKVLSREFSAGAHRFVADLGPNGFLDNEPATLDLASKLGLADRLLRSSEEARRRYVYRDSALHKLPESPPAFLKSDLLSWRGKARVALDLLVPRARTEAAERESVAEFARRRVGAEALTAMVEPFVTGVFAGDPEQLELATAFPKMAKLEREHGGLVKALLSLERKRRRETPPGGEPKRTTICSFRDGMSELTGALAHSLGDRIWTQARATQLLPLERDRWLVSLDHRGWPTTLEADAVVLATPAPEAAALLAPFAPEVAREAESVTAAPIAVVILGFSESAARPAAFDGFGFLIARGEKLQILGALAESSIWPSRVRNERGETSDGFLARVMIGGVHRPELVDLDDSELIRIATEDLARATGLSASPILTHVERWHRAIPQYVLGHGERMKRIDAALQPHKTLQLAGASWRGVAVNDLCRNAASIAERVHGALRRTTPHSSPG
ncbi:MAG: protoporphyrinogen oxidase [Planctomycetes bacterium]|nr:protoporphyrinogen oxidase [Planctomycetota bacterium]